jgi:lipoprotein-releasing system ATP-binding protein
MEIRTVDIQKSYSISRGIEIKALRDIDLTIHSGETAAIVGPSGAGKSTLLHILGLMDRPTAGTMYFDGQEVGLLPDAEYTRLRREKIGFLFQLHYLLPEFTVWENVLIPVWGRKKEKEKDASVLLEQLGLAKRAHHLPAELSGGEQQRAALARALINEPHLLLADEPTGNLDRETGETVETIIFEECHKRHITLVLVTHNPELAAKAGTLIRMKDGLIVQ